MTTTAQSTIERQLALHDVMEAYIERRRRAFLPKAREIAAEAGISDAELLFLMHLRQVADGDTLRVARLRRRAVYSTKEGWRTRLEALERVGLVERSGEDWRLTQSGSGLVARAWSATREQQRALPLPQEPLHRVVAALEEAVRDAPARDTDRLSSVRRMAPPDERTHDAVRAEQAMFELAVTHDDGHIAAWESAGYSGTALDVLTQVWYGHDTVAKLRAALATKQEEADTDRHIAELVHRGDLERDGDAVRLTAQGRAMRERIEAETHRLGFARWPRGEALERLFADIEALVATLPAEEELPKGPTH